MNQHDEIKGGRHEISPYRFHSFINFLIFYNALP